MAQTEEYIEQLLSLSRAAGEEESEAKRAIRTLYVFKDVRLFLNTITRAVDTMRRSGVAACVEREEEAGGIRLTIRIPNAR